MFRLIALKKREWGTSMLNPLVNKSLYLHRDILNSDPKEPNGYF